MEHPRGRLRRSQRGSIGRAPNSKHALTRSPSHGLVTGASIGQISSSYDYSDYVELSSMEFSYASASLYRFEYDRDDRGRVHTRRVTQAGGTSVYYCYEYDDAG